MSLSMGWQWRKQVKESNSIWGDYLWPASSAHSEKRPHCHCFLLYNIWYIVYYSAVYCKYCIAYYIKYSTWNYFVKHITLCIYCKYAIAKVCLSVSHTVQSYILSMFIVFVLDAMEQPHECIFIEDAGFNLGRNITGQCGIVEISGWRVGTVILCAAVSNWGFSTCMQTWSHITVNFSLHFWVVYSTLCLHMNSWISKNCILYMS